MFDIEDVADLACEIFLMVSRESWRLSRAIGTGNAKLILLDEPAAGMNPTEFAEVMEIITKVKK
ncbi:MAG: hypothetical protein V8S96_06235 [Lachnospiraceae bacterium]